MLEEQFAKNITNASTHWDIINVNWRLVNGDMNLRMENVKVRIFRKASKWDMSIFLTLHSTKSCYVCGSRMVPHLSFYTVSINK